MRSILARTGHASSHRWATLTVLGVLGALSIAIRRQVADLADWGVDEAANTPPGMEVV